NEKETTRSPANPRDCNFGCQASMADEFNGDTGQPRFNFFEFLTLAHKVVDSGDMAAMDALSDLKQKWELKYGRPARFPAKTARYVQPPVRRAVRCLLDETAEKNQPENNCVAAAEISDSAAEFLAGKRPIDELGMTQKSQQQSAALVGGNSMGTQHKTTSILATTASKALMMNTTIGVNSIENSRNTKSNSHSGIFIGNIPLHASSDNCLDDDKIARAFNNSSRKTLSYIAPTKQNGDIVVLPSLDIVRDGSKRWKFTAVGYFLGKRPYYHHLKEFAHSVWPALREVTATVNGFFFFRFKTVIDMEEVIEGGPWLFQGQPIVVQKWEPGMAMRKLKHTQVLVWIKLRHLPMEFWTTEGLSTVASEVGKPLYPDAITRACTRLNFARVCVMIDVTQTIAKHIIIMTPDEDGGETPCKPSIAVYVQKAVVLPQPTAPEKGSNSLNHTADETPRREANDVHVERNVSKHSDKGKEVVIYNAFDALHLLDDAEEPTRGPNISSPVSSDPC
ncbi:UNVERIFIED_CONTAM: hypothetical protein Sindi_2019300, partial [Sesamum indicum]